MGLNLDTNEDGEIIFTGDPTGKHGHLVRNLIRATRDFERELVVSFIRDVAERESNQSRERALNWVAERISEGEHWDSITLVTEADDER